MHGDGVEEELTDGERAVKSLVRLTLIAWQPITPI